MPDPLPSKPAVGDRVFLFGMPLDIKVEEHDVLTRVASGKLLLSYLNPYAYSFAKANPEYSSQLNQFDLVVCDGIGVQVAVKTVFKLTTAVISLDYSGIGHEYLQLGAELNFSLCLVGGERRVVDAAAGNIKTKHPGFERISAFNGYGSSPEEAKKFILESKPDLVLVGLGIGMQESYLLELLELLELLDCGWSGVGICVGGFFDKIANPDLDYPEWSKKTNLRFLGRLVREPS